MNKNMIEQKINSFFSPEWLESFRGIKRGFEKECLRVDKKGMIAKTPHPKILGSSLTHPMIVTDFSEAQLEFITPPTESIPMLMNTLMELHHFTYQILNDEYLWTASMPPILPKKEEDIPIATYGSSNYGQLKEVYRRGLSYRYGRKMQTISGTHYNFSLPMTFWEKYHHFKKSNDSLSHFVSEQYLSMIRNCLRFGWLLPFLFGASPAMTTDFINQELSYLTKLREDTWFGSYATSLRISDLGYSSRVQRRGLVSYNSLSEYLKSMHGAVHTPVPMYSKIGVKEKGEYRQLSDCILQVEDEHYDLFRPKRMAHRDERMVFAIEREGIEYVEVRALETNPFVPIGITDETVYLLDSFLLACLFADSLPLSSSDYVRINHNFEQVANFGRKPGLLLTKETGEEVDILEWTKEIMFSMDTVAKLLDRVYGGKEFTDACWKMNTFPSARILAELFEREESYADFVLRWSDTHQLYFKTKPMLPESFAFYRHLTEKSFQDLAALESQKDLTFDEFLRKYLEA